MKKRLLTALLLLATTARAHDFWIEPSAYRTTVGTMITTRLRVGENFAGEPIARASNLLDVFVAKDVVAQRDIPGVEGDDPAGALQLKFAGLTIVGYRGKGVPHQMPAERFEDYLRLEGADQVIAERARRGATKRKGMENFYRFAKSYLYAPPNADTPPGDLAPSTPLGWRCELVAESNPYTDTGEELTFRLLLEGKPLSDTLVVAMNHEQRLTARTDGEGRVTFRVSAGEWLIKSTVIVPAPRGARAEWESLWASLTFSR